MENKIWKDIPEYEGLYQVSNFGEVKSLSKPRNVFNSCYIAKERILKPALNDKGYKVVVLTKNKKHKTFRVHRLVALAFINNYESKPQVNHIDGNKLNNNIENLEWCTNGENEKHAYKLGLKKINEGCFKKGHTYLRRKK
jgi:hypothetical protein